jgi:hypothetical protein
MMKDCVVLAGDACDANTAANWAASCAERARMTAEEAKAIAAQVRDVYVKACDALFGERKVDRMVMLSATFDKGAPQFELFTDGALKCDALGPKSDDCECDGLTCFKLKA